GHRPRRDPRRPLLRTTLFRSQVAKVCAGGSHTAFLTTDGEVWTCGRGEYGLCGNGGTEDQLTPSPLEAFEESIIVDVQVGGSL
ncbi:unnamed protein product, partial [Hapterophycus canaliculatus]